MALSNLVDTPLYSILPFFSLETFPNDGGMSSYPRLRDKTSKRVPPPVLSLENRWPASGEFLRDAALRKFPAPGRL